MAKELVDLTLVYFPEKSSGKAYAVAEDKEHDLVWLPRSQVYMDESSERILHGGRKCYVFTMPEWLAIEKELI